jgi:hypothetical protein
VVDWDSLGAGLLGSSTAALAATVVSVGVKEALFWATLAVGKKSNSSVVIGNAWHHRSDALSSVVAFVVRPLPSLFPALTLKSFPPLLFRWSPLLYS